jgi:probable F420-dependent oxidoreductase
MPHDRRFRFAVICAGTTTPDAKSFTELAKRAEGSGFSTLYVPDHFIDHPIAPPVALAHAAAVTTTLRVGSLVLGNDYKHPVVLAREMATLDMLSSGRLELGIGAGWMTADYEQAGIPLDPAGVRIERLAESITVLKGLFAPGPFTFEGNHYRVRELDGAPKPVQQPVPFVIGGGGPKILTLAAKEADIVGINANLRSGDGNSTDAAKSLTPAATDTKLETLRAAAGARFDDLEIQTLVGFAHVTDDAAPIHEGMASHFGISPDEARLAPVTLVGSIDEMAAQLEERRDRWQMSYIVIDAAFSQACEPLVAKLAGK